MNRFIFIITFLKISFFSFSQNRLKLESTLAMPDVSWDIYGFYDSLSQKEYAIIGSNGITIVDIEDRKNPKIVSSIPNVTNFDHKIWKNYIYTVSGSGVDNSIGYIINISDIEQPIVVDSFPSAHNLFIDNNGFMYASNPGVIIYDLNNSPTKPDSLTKIGFEGHDVTVVDNILYDFHGRYGTNLYDVSDKSNPKLLAYIDDPTLEYHHQGWPSSDGKYLYICDELSNKTSADISVWDIQDLENPERIGEFSDNSATVHNIYIKGDWAYSSYYAAGIRMFDVSNPEEIVLTDEYDTTPDLDLEGFEGVFGIYPFAKNNTLLVSERNKGLYIFTFDTLRAQDTIKVDFEIDFSPTLLNKFLNVRIVRGTEKLEDNIFQLKVINTLGQSVFYDKITLKDIYQKKYHLRNLKKGIYYVSLSNSNVKLTKRIFTY